MNTAMRQVSEEDRRAMARRHMERMDGMNGTEMRGMMTDAMPRDADGMRNMVRRVVDDDDVMMGMDPGAMRDITDGLMADMGDDAAREALRGVMADEDSMEDVDVATLRRVSRGMLDGMDTEDARALAMEHFQGQSVTSDSSREQVMTAIRTGMDGADRDGMRRVAQRMARGSGGAGLEGDDVRRAMRNITEGMDENATRRAFRGMMRDVTDNNETRRRPSGGPGRDHLEDLMLDMLDELDQPGNERGMRGMRGMMDSMVTDTDSAGVDAMLTRMMGDMDDDEMMEMAQRMAEGNPEARAALSSMMEMFGDDVTMEDVVDFLADFDLANLLTQCDRRTSVRHRMRMTVDNPAEFVAHPESQGAVERAIARRAGVDEGAVSATLSVGRRLVTAAGRMLQQSGSVSADTEIFAEDESGVASLQTSVGGMVADDLNSAIAEEMAAADPDASFTVTVAADSMTTEAVEETFTEASQALPTLEEEAAEEEANAGGGGASGTSESDGAQKTAFFSGVLAAMLAASM